MREDTPELRKLLEIKEESNAAAAKDAAADANADGSSSRKLGSKEQLDLARVKALYFINCLVASPGFVGKLLDTLAAAAGSKKKTKALHKLLKSLMEVSIVNIEHFEKKVDQANSGSGERSARLQKQFASLSERILEKNLSLLPSKVFVQVLTDLLNNDLSVIRRKSLEVLNVKFQRPDDPIVDSDAADQGVLELLDPLVSLSKGKVPVSHADETPANQQLALLCLRSFTRSLGASHPEAFFKSAASELAKKSFLKELESSPVIAATLLCLTDMFQAIGPHAVLALQPFAQFLLDLMNRDQVRIQDNPVVLSSIVYAVKTCMENFGGFLNPYYGRLVTATCRLSSYNDVTSASDVTSGKKSNESRLRHLHTAISKGIPTHSLLAILSECHQSVALESPHSVVALSNMLRDNVSGLDKNAALSIATPFLAYFVEAFKYRQNSTESDVTVTKVEDELIETFMTLVLKLSLDDFKPMFYRLFGSTVEDEDNLEATTTVFRVTAELARRLKSLFGFISESLIHKSNAFLNKFSRDEFKALKEGDEHGLLTKKKQRVVEMTLAILSALSAIYTYNRVETLQIQNYEEHVNAILNYFECPLDNEESEEEAGLELALLQQIKECLGQLAASTDDETPWKYLNYQVLLNIRNSSLKVRMCVLETVSLFVEKKGEAYLSVLPDSVPLLAEALEDDDIKVETRCKQLIKEMESAFGHSIDHYFE